MDCDVLNDQQLVSEYVKGNESAFELLLNRHKDRVYSYIYNMVRESELAEDLFQDTFIKVVKSLKSGQYDEDGRFIGWVLRIAHNLAIDHFRRKSKMQTVSNENGEYDLFNDVKLAEEYNASAENKVVLSKELKELINRLPYEQKATVMMRHCWGMSFKEIAESMDVSINTALGRMRYAVRNMRQIVEEEKIELTID